MNQISDDTILQLHAASFRFGHMARGGIRRSGCHPGEIHLLSTIIEAEQGRIAPSVACRVMRMHPPTLSAIAARLEEQGLVNRIPSATDGRKVYLEATPKGTKLYKGVQADILRFYRGFVSRLSSEELAQLIMLLNKITQVDDRQKEDHTNAENAG